MTRYWQQLLQQQRQRHKQQHICVTYTSRRHVPPYSNQHTPTVIRLCAAGCGMHQHLHQAGTHDDLPSSSLQQPLNCRKPCACCMDLLLQAAQEGVQILSLAVLLSSLFVFNQMGPIDEAALDRLSLVTEITQRIRIRASSTEPGGWPGSSHTPGQPAPDGYPIAGKDGEAWQFATMARHRLSRAPGSAHTWCWCACRGYADAQQQLTSLLAALVTGRHACHRDTLNCAVMQAYSILTSM